MASQKLINAVISGVIKEERTVVRTGSYHVTEYIGVSQGKRNDPNGYWEHVYERGGYESHNSFYGKNGEPFESAKPVSNDGLFRGNYKNKMPIISNLLSLNPDSPIELFEISNYNLSSPSETLYICNYVGVSFEGQAYAAIGCESEGFDLIGQGPIPTPQLTVSNIGRVVSTWLTQCKTDPNYRLEGTTVKRRVTQRQFLDGGENEGDSIKELLPQIFVIEQLVSETYLAVQFRLGSPFDVEGVTLPARPLLRSCSWRYRAAECGYLGGGFTINNVATLDPALDVCAKTLTACETRFGTAVDLPFGGAPGLNTYS